MFENYRWLIFALLGALFAAVTQVLSKPALERLDVSVANTLRAVVMLAVLTLITTWQGRWWTLVVSPRRAVALISLAGVAAALSWYFGYKALKLSSVGQSYPIDKLSIVFAVLLAVAFLGERPSLLNWAGMVVMLIGAFLVSK